MLAQTLRARHKMMNDILYRSFAVLFGLMVFVMIVLWVAINRALEPLRLYFQKPCFPFAFIGRAYSNYAYSRSLSTGKRN
ncbi:hypothetical protein [Marinomonas rhodophyticola]|uniref:Uncharacterized protein n=1 Tax=Marinomonas rhodophyticola TaxID=2992803 RepID=A0ABT3KI73_9GAMM|nr:hypothetical protein [Marinomonas sp. KJ51-3]MCW4630243.1 hypothetical protein [Marinomonas sp. KJ51-3]